MQSTKFIWDEHDQLIRVELPNQERWRYRYDPFGRRISKECEQSKRLIAPYNLHYRWDGDNLVQQQRVYADGTPHSITEYIYEPDSFRPLAQVDTNHITQDSSLSYIVTDHAGTPRELCSESGEVIWRGRQATWGEYHYSDFQGLHKQYLEDPANDPVICDLRHQGQIFDRETGLYYNRHRYYDTDIGQYLSSDPIGMAGGLRPQAYVFNPVDWVDPLGLAASGCPNKKQEKRKASDLPVIKPGTKEWRETVESMKNAKGHSHNYRVANQKDAKALLDEAKPNTMHSKPHARGKKKTQYRHEYHRSNKEGYMPDTNLDHDLEHLKWYDYRGTNSSGHIFYDKWT